MRKTKTLKYLNISIQPIKVFFYVFSISDFVHFLLDIKILTVLSKRHIYSKFCLIFFYVLFDIKIRLLCFVESWLYKQFAIFFILGQKLTKWLLPISSESFIVAKIFQYYFTTLFALYIYSATQLIVIFFLLQKLLSEILINFFPLLVCKYPGFSLQTLAYNN